MEKKDGGIATAQNQDFRAEISFSGVPPENALEIIGSRLPGVRIETEEDSGRNCTTLITPALAYGDMETFLGLWRDLSAQGARSGLGMRLWADLGADRRCAANLVAIIESKGHLLAKAVRTEWRPGTYTPPKIGQDGMVEVFPFPVAKGLDEDEMRACIQLGLGIAAQAQSQNRVVRRVLETDNDRYAFRCWMLRMGLIGDEFKDCRRLFLSRLQGSSSRR